MEKITKRVVNIILFVAFVILIICIGISKKTEGEVRKKLKNFSRFFKFMLFELS